jgi:hypothetical protein
MNFSSKQISMQKIIAIEYFLIVKLLHCIDGNNQSQIAKTILVVVGP